MSADEDLEDEEYIAPEEMPSKSKVGEDRPTVIEEILKATIVEKKLTFEEASNCLNTLGKDESGVRYAYLMLTAMDKLLTDISIILNFKHLLFLDLSGNYLNLEALQVVTQLPYLIYLKAQRNMLQSADLKPAPYLQVMSLAKNQIAETCEIDQPILESLDLNHNEIFTVQFVEERLPEIKQLEMRGNHIFDFSGSFPRTLEILYMAQNNLCRIVMDDLSRLGRLRILHLRDNKIRKLNGFSERLVNLKYLNLRQNKIRKFRQFYKLRVLPALEVLIIMQNPVSGDYIGEEMGAEDMPPPSRKGDESEIGEDGEQVDITSLVYQYTNDPCINPYDIEYKQIPLLVLLPHLKRINKQVVTFDEREEAREVAAERLEEIMNEDSSEDEDQENLTTTDYTTGYTSDADDGKVTSGADAEIEDTDTNN